MRRDQMNVLSDAPNVYVTVSDGEVWEQTLVGEHAHAIADSGGAICVAVSLVVLLFAW